MTSDDDGGAREITLTLPLSAGLSLVSLPLRTASSEVEEIFPNLPAGSRVLTWNASAQRFVSDGGTLALGEACWISVPVATVLEVTGQSNLSLEVPLELHRGWNLIGVPFEFEIARADQTVYVHHAKTGFNDAVAAGAIGGTVWGFGGEGYFFVGENDSFEPLAGYWVYSKDFQLLELHPKLLRGGGGYWGAALKAVGSALISAGVNYGISTFLFSAGETGNPEMTEKLSEISGQLTAVVARQKDMQLQLESVIGRLNLNTATILQAIGDAAYVGPARTSLLTHYDQMNANESLVWFGAQGAGGQSISNRTKSEFAVKVLDTWRFIDTFNGINTGIMGATGSSPGLLDSFAEQVIYSSTPGTLQDRYSALEAYFNTLLGMQIKCGTLVMNAYTQLANDPDHAGKYTRDTAEKWHNEVFEPVIREEVERFRTVVERVALAKLVLPRNADDPPVDIPLEVQNILSSADYLVMNTLDEPGGLRVRVITSPHIDMLSHVVWGKLGTAGARYQLPPIDQWQILPGKQKYDSWGYGGTWPDGTREFRFTNAWSVVRARFDADDDVNYEVWLNNDPYHPTFGNCWFCGPRERLPSTQWVRMQPRDVDEDPATPPRLFGSVTFAKRIDAVAMLNPCMDSNISPVTSGKCRARNPAPDQKPEPCDDVSMFKCEWSPGVKNLTGAGVPFKYVGADSEVGRVWGTAIATTAPHPTSSCSSVEPFHAMLELRNGKGSIRETITYLEPPQATIRDWEPRFEATVHQYLGSTEWLPGETYQLVRKLWWESAATGPCQWAKLKYLDALLCPGPAEVGEQDCHRRSGD